MRSKAYHILKNSGGRLHWSRLASCLFAAEQINPQLGEKLVDTLLLPDARFQKDRKGHWSIKEETTDPLSQYLDRAIFTVVDVETTGGRPPLHRVMEIAAVKVAGGEITGHYHSMINPGRYIPPFVASMTGISDELVAAMPAAEKVMPAFLNFMGDSVFVAHNAIFDLMFINHELQNMDMEALRNRVLCTQMLAKRLIPEVEKHSLDVLAASLGIHIEGRHRAMGDATAAAHILIAFLRKASHIGIERVQELLQLQNSGLGQNLFHMKKEWPLFADLPERPGAYLMKDQAGRLLYVGRGGNIKERVRAHYYSRKRVPTRTVKMLEKVKKIECRLTDSELSAILLESELTKKFHPRYNVDGRFYRSYPFLKVTVNKPYPRVYTVKEVLPDGALYFGPYKNLSHGRAVAEALNNKFLLRRCHTAIGGESGKTPCSYHHMKLCAAPCAGRVSQAEYGEAVQQALETLTRASSELLQTVQERLGRSGKDPGLGQAPTLKLKHDRLRKALTPGGIGSTPLHLLNIIIAVPGIYQGEVELFFIRAGELRKRVTSAVSDLQGRKLLGAIRSCYFREPEVSRPEKKRYQEIRLIANWLLQNRDSAAIIRATDAASPGTLAEKLQHVAAQLWNF